MWSIHFHRRTIVEVIPPSPEEVARMADEKARYEAVHGPMAMFMAFGRALAPPEEEEGVPGVIVLDLTPA